MKLLEEMIMNKGKVLPGNVLKVGTFLNQQLDISLISQMGEEIYTHFKGCGVNKILTIEASGIGMACITAQFFHCNVVFAKKSKTSNMSSDVYSSTAFSYTHQNNNTIVVSKEYLGKDDKVLIIDDFLAHGEACNALIDIIGQAGAELCGVAIGIEKSFQGAGDKMRKKGIDLLSLAQIESMNDDKIVFRR